MISQLTSNPTEATRTRQLSIQLQAEHAESIIPFLVSSQIPFTVTFNENIFPQFGSEIGYSLPLGTQKTQLRPTTILQKEEEAIQQVYQKYCIDEIETIPPQANEIAQNLGMSPTKFKNLFRKYYGQPFYHLFVDKKMQHAAKLLKMGYKACEVSQKVGYAHPIKFSKMFQKHFGITPKKFQQSQAYTV